MKEGRFRNFSRKMFGIIVVNSEGQRKEWLEGVGQTVSDYFPRDIDTEPAAEARNVRRVGIRMLLIKLAIAT